MFLWVILENYTTRTHTNKFSRRVKTDLPKNTSSFSATVEHNCVNIHTRQLICVSVVQCTMSCCC